MPIYHLYEWSHAMMQPWRATADATRLFYQNPLHPMSRTKFGRTVAAWAEVFERTTRRYGKPHFGLDITVVDDKEVPVVEHVVWSKPFCNL
ncbi:MAG: polyhydroxyalkanoate depolymerase, partial [Pseudomonadota bacterium]